MDWFYNYPDMSRSDLRDFKKSVDFAFTDFSRAYGEAIESCLLYTSPSPRDISGSRMPSSA